MYVFKILRAGRGVDNPLPPPLYVYGSYLTFSFANRHCLNSIYLQSYLTLICTYCCGVKELVGVYVCVCVDVCVCVLEMLQCEIFSNQAFPGGQG